MPPITSTLLVFLATIVAFIGLDAVWLSLIAIPMFRGQIGELLRPDPILGAVAAFYAIYAMGIVALAVRPALMARSPADAAAKGALLGLTAYATFDLTNLAVIKGWSIGLAAVDMAWGVSATAVAALAGYFAGAAVERRS